MRQETSAHRRRLLGRGVASLIALAMAAGCASTKETERENLASGNLMQPNQIWVHNFAAMPADMAARSTLAAQASQGAAPLSAQQMADGRNLGSEIAAELIQQIKAMGLPATNASPASRPQVDDVVIQGSLLSIQQSEPKAEAEIYQMTAHGMQLLGWRDLVATGNSSSTVESAKQMAQEIAVALKTQFRKQGWIH